MTKLIEKYKNSNQTIGLLTVLLPPLAVILKNGEIKNRRVLITLLLTLMLWLPGVAYAIWICFKISPNEGYKFSKNKNKLSSSVLMRPIPIYPETKANAIISYPTSQFSIIINFPSQMIENIQCKNEFGNFDLVSSSLSNQIV